MVKLTESFIDGAEPRKCAAETVYFDDHLIGFGLRVKASGSKSFVLQYRNARGKSRRLTLGQHGRLTAAQARREAKIALGDVERGRDPAQERQEARGAMSIEELCTEYLEAAEKGLVLGKRRRPKKQSTLSVDRGRISRHIVPLLGKKAVREVTSADIVRFMHAVSSGKTKADVRTVPRGRAIVRGGVSTAARTVGLLGGIFSYARSLGYRHDNPISGIPKPASNRRTRRLTIEEYHLLGDALAEAESEGENPVVIAAVRLLALTGCRRNEIAQLQYSELDRKARALVLADTKEGESVRPLSAAALRVVDALPESLRGGKYVLPGPDSRYPHRGLPRAIERVMARRSALKGVTAHVLRHGFASVASELGFVEITVAALLGHRSGTVTSRYIHHIDSVLVAAADHVADLIEDAMAGKAQTAEIKDFPKPLVRDGRRP